MSLLYEEHWPVISMPEKNRSSYQEKLSRLKAENLQIF